MSDLEFEQNEFHDAIRKLIRETGQLNAAQPVKRASVCHETQDLEFKEKGDKVAQLWTTMAELGFFGLAVKEQYGGLEMGYTELAVLYQELGRQLVNLPVMTTLLFAQLIDDAGSTIQKEKWLPLVASGDVSATVVLPKLRENSFNAFEVKDGHVNGQQAHVLDADIVDILLIPINNEGVNSDKEQVQFLIINTSSPQVTVSLDETVDQTRGLCKVVINDLELLEQNLVTVPKPMLERAFNHAGLAIACDCVGGAQNILEKTVEYMKVRQQFNRPIGSFQALKHRCSDWKIDLEAATALVSEAVKAGVNDTVWASRAKYYSSDTYAAIAGDTIQLHGGIGFTWEYDCHLFFKRAKLNQVLFGTSSWHKDSIAKMTF